MPGPTISAGVRVRNEGCMAVKRSKSSNTALTMRYPTSSDMALVAVDTPFVAKARDRAAGQHGRKFGNYVRAILSIIFGWGMEPGYTKSNPAFAGGLVVE